MNAVFVHGLLVTATTSDGGVEAHAYEYLRPLDGCPDVGSVWTKNLPR